MGLTFGLAGYAEVPPLRATMRGGGPATLLERSATATLPVTAVTDVTDRGGGYTLTQEFEAMTKGLYKDDEDDDDEDDENEEDEEDDD